MKKIKAKGRKQVRHAKKKKWKAQKKLKRTKKATRRGRKRGGRKRKAARGGSKRKAARGGRITVQVLRKKAIPQGQTCVSKKPVKHKSVQREKNLTKLYNNCKKLVAGAPAFVVYPADAREAQSNCWKCSSAKLRKSKMKAAFVFVKVGGKATRGGRKRKAARKGRKRKAARGGRKSKKKKTSKKKSAGGKVCCQQTGFKPILLNKCRGFKASIDMSCCKGRKSKSSKPCGSNVNSFGVNKRKGRKAARGGRKRKAAPRKRKAARGGRKRKAARGGRKRKAAPRKRKAARGGRKRRGGRRGRKRRL
jgi:hypothetical protein